MHVAVYFTWIFILTRGPFDGNYNSMLVAIAMCILLKNSSVVYIVKCMVVCVMLYLLV